MNQVTIFPGNRRFNSYSAFIKARFEGRIQKISVDAGFTCPNRDGSIGTGGCSFCNNKAFNPSYCREEGSLTNQIQEGIKFHRKRYKSASQYMVYFQAYTNTYDNPGKLEKLYREALSHPGVVALSIGTRPDCLPDSVMKVLERLSKEVFLNLEIGIESCYDRSLKAINRGHDFEKTRDAFYRAGKAGIFTTGHMIIGLPGESREEILAQAGILSKLPVSNLKFHQLQMIAGTVLGDEYLKDPQKFTDLSIGDYLELMVEFIERLSPDILVDRIAGETVPGYNLRENWGMRYDVVLREFEKILERKNTWQGKFYNIKT